MTCEPLFTRHMAGDRLGRHRHRESYAAVVIEGGYQEAGDRGRLFVEAGHVVFHGAHEAHCNAFPTTGAVVLNLPVGFDRMPLARIANPDELVRLAERDVRAATDYLCATIMSDDARCDDWPSLLARRLIDSPDLDLTGWAMAHGLAPQSLSRGFRQIFGVTPKRFRAEQRALHAMRLAAAWRGRGAALAAELGFADQAHMSRSVRALAGKRPSDIDVK